MKESKADPKLVDIANQKKEKMAMKTYDLNGFVANFKNEKSMVAEVKIDGEFTLLYINDGDIKFISPSGRVRTDFSLWEEVKKNFGHLKRTTIYGELYVVDENGFAVPYNQALLVLRNPTKENENRIFFSVFDIDQINGKIIEDDYNIVYSTIVEMFNNPIDKKKDYKYIHAAPGRFCGNIECVEDLWKQWVVGKKQEGLVVHVGDKAYKVKETFPVDAVVIGITKGLSEARDELGAVLVAFMDKDGNFIQASKVGTGFTKEMRKEWYEWAMKNKVEGPNTKFIWVNPERIIEIKAEQYYKSKGDAYKFTGKNYSLLDNEGNWDTITFRKPVFVRIRLDKRVSPENLRLEQIPESELILKGNHVTFLPSNFWYGELITDIESNDNKIDNVFITNNIKYVYEIGTKKLINASLSKSFWTAMSYMNGEILLISNNPLIEEQSGPKDYWKPDKVQHNKITTKDFKATPYYAVFTKTKKYFADKVIEAYVFKNEEGDIYLKIGDVKYNIIGSNIKGYEPKNPETIIIKKNEYYKNGLNEMQIWEYYQKVKKEMLPQFADRNVGLVKQVDGKMIFQRKDQDKYIVVNSESYDKYNNGRTVEWHPILEAEESFGFVDIDPQDKVEFEFTKKTTKDLHDFLSKKYKITEVRFSGSRGFHIYFQLNKRHNVDKTREETKKLLIEFIGNNSRLTLGLAKPNQIRLDITTLHRMGSLRALYSLHKKTGLVCDQVNPAGILAVKKDNYKIDK